MVELEEIAATMESVPSVLRSMLTPIDAASLCVRPEPEEWCVREVIGHLIATDTGAFADRIAAIVAGEPQIAGFDPWAAIRARDFTAGPLGELLDEFARVRRRSADFVRSLTPSDLSRTAEYGSRGTFAAGDFVHEWPYHDQEHLRQILAALQPRYVASMSVTMCSALLGTRRDRAPSDDIRR
jgi:hypothetical protein